MYITEERYTLTKKGVVYVNIERGNVHITQRGVVYTSHTQGSGVHHMHHTSHRCKVQLAGVMYTTHIGWCTLHTEWRQFSLHTEDIVHYTPHTEGRGVHHTPHI